MGMRIGSYGADATSQSSSVANWQQRQQSFKALTSALQSGNLSGAQQAFASLSGNSIVQGNSLLAQLGQALKNNDLSGAQQAAELLKGSRSSNNGGGASAVTAPQPALNTSGTGMLINVTA